MAYDSQDFVVINRGAEYGPKTAAVSGTGDCLVTPGTAGTVNIAAGELYLGSQQIIVGAQANLAVPGLVANTVHVVGFKPVYQVPVVQIGYNLSNPVFPTTAEQAAIGALHATAKGSAVVAGDHVIVAQGLSGRIYRAITATTYYLPGSEAAKYAGADTTLTAGVSIPAGYSVAIKKPAVMLQEQALSFKVAKTITAVQAFALPLTAAGPYAETASFESGVDPVKWAGLYANYSTIDPDVAYAKQFNSPYINGGMNAANVQSFIRKGQVFPLATVTTTALSNVVVVNKDLRQVLPKVTSPAAN